MEQSNQTDPAKPPEQILQRLVTEEIARRQVVADIGSEAANI